MNTPAKIIIAILIILVTFFGLYSFIKAKEADRLYTLVLEAQQLSLKEKERVRQLSEQAAKSAAEAIQSAIEAERAIEMAKAAIEECEKRRK
jgi:uncharacterized protein HemX